MSYVYDHFGVPTKEKREKMTHFPDFRVWCSNYEKDPYRIEWIYFEEGSTLHPLIQRVPHVCFIVKDIHAAVKGKKILLEPMYYQGYYMAFIQEDEVPIEFIQPGSAPLR